MTFKTVDQIHQHLATLVKSERKITFEILQHIQLFDKVSGYLKFGYGSLFEYLTKHLKYSENQAYRRIKSAKLLNTIPAAAEKIQNGSINLTQAAFLQKAIDQTAKCKTQHSSNHSNHSNESKEIREKLQTVINNIENKNSFETQKIIAESFELPVFRNDQVKPQSNNTVKLEIHLSHEQFQKLQQVKKMLSHQYPDQKNSEILEYLCNLVLQKGEKKPRKLEKSNLDSSSKPDISSTLTSSTSSSTSSTIITQSLMLAQDTEASNNKSTNKPSRRSRHIPNDIRKFVMKRAKNQCEFISTEGVKCGSNYKLEIDHVNPFSNGGEHCIENLKCLCARHNAFSATQLGIGFELMI